jgi:hypothetical protein
VETGLADHLCLKNFPLQPTRPDCPVVRFAALKSQNTKSLDTLAAQVVSADPFSPLLGSLMAIDHHLPAPARAEDSSETSRKRNICSVLITQIQMMFE